ncbi:DUF1549 domain-containing protein [Gimesia sp.]|uniref:DUF1549 domain-containing protein n=1 Tax=Gimesia sp. TaxID=2024833 RepID=UPI000C54166B|nr:DUF1549 domain-containing protein [Gimesia sp.]MAX38860.1 S-layer protein [Gimesia sp.]HBL43359.1 S-layer protein [Planctomycetaceae bacterium]|tara:strand:- start:2901 stop:5453 length:2553 start_codon:yes stop_codon:yes gene_type:complete
MMIILKQFKTENSFHFCKSSIGKAVLCLLLSLFGMLRAATASEAEQKPAAEILPAKISPQQTVRLKSWPEKIHLRGRDSRQQLLVTGFTADEKTFDLTRAVKFKLKDPQLASVDDLGVITPEASGKTELEISWGSLKQTLPVVIEQGETFLPLSFENDIAPILTRQGCNGGGCHGKSDGRGGFQLSLFGFQPEQDYEWITRDIRGRRIFPAAPEDSLLLRKATMKIPHGGGKRLEESTPEYNRMVRWIEANTPRGPADTPQIVKLTVEPAFESLGHHDQQQLTGTAHYSDGSRRDVTPLVEFRSKDTSVATVDARGLVTSLERTGETSVLALYQGEVSVSKILVPSNETPEAWPAFPITNFIDEHIQRKLKVLAVPPSPLADDATFIRRATLQIAGKLPTPDEVDSYTHSTDPRKRQQLIDRLVHSGDYADHFAQKWSDLLRNKRRGQRNRQPGTIAFHRWLRNKIAANAPYDELVRGVLTATGDVSVNPPAQWYAEVRYLDRYVDDMAQVFLGLRIGCARCHHHPFEKYSQQDYYGLAAFFSRVNRTGGTGVAERRANEMISVKQTGQVKHPVTGEVVPPHGLGGPDLEIAPFEDPRHYLVDWMAEKQNPYFARAFVNRMWAHFFGRGLVHPLDDLRVTNPASNEPLLEELAEEFTRSGYDMRHIVNLICTSTTYQLGSEANEINLEETQNYARFYPQRLSAEILLDAIDDVTDTPTRYSGLPKATRALQLPDEDYSNQFLTLFGRPKRESACECERVSEPSLSQSLFVMNNSFILSKAMGGYASTLAKDKKTEESKIRELFLKSLSREPTEREMKNALAYLASEKDKKAAFGNLVWTLLNTKEFLFVH